MAPPAPCARTGIAQATRRTLRGAYGCAYMASSKLVQATGESESPAGLTLERPPQNAVRRCDPEG